MMTTKNVRCDPICKYCGEKFYREDNERWAELGLGCVCDDCMDDKAQDCDFGD